MGDFKKIVAGSQIITPHFTVYIRDTERAGVFFEFTN